MMQVLKCTRKKLDSNWVNNESNRILALLVHLSPEKVYLFGSAAENKMTDQSDFDFLLVFESGAAIREAQKKLRPHYPLSSFATDLVWTTAEEFERKKDIGGICFVVHKDGKCLFKRER